MKNVDIIEVMDVQALIQAAVQPMQLEIDDLKARVTGLEQGTGGSGEDMDLTIPAGWKVVLRENFELDCAEGSFGQLYGNRQIGFYPGPGETSQAAYGTASGGAAGYTDTSKRGTYTGKYISVGDSICYQRGFTDANGKIWVSALCPFAKPGGTAKWGDVPGIIFEQRTRFFMDVGYKMAHLFWPVSNKNNPDGELDWPEAENKVAKAYLHHQNPDINGVQTIYTPNPPVDISQWHTYRTEWKKGQYAKFFVDGVLVGEMSGLKIPQLDMHIVLQNETSLLRNSSGAYIQIPTVSKYRVETDWMQYLIPA